MTDAELGKVAWDTYYYSRQSGLGIWERIAKAVKEQVLADLHAQEKTFTAGQELTLRQVAIWVEEHGSLRGLQVYNSFNVPPDIKDNTNMLNVTGKFRVKPDANDPADPTT